MPRRARRSQGTASRSAPSSRMRPPAAGTRPMMALIVLDLPAPLAPTSRTVSPSGTSMDTPDSAVMPP